MSSPAEVVADQFSLATGYADAAISQANSYITALGSAIYTTPLISVTWAAIDAPSAVTIPDPPALLDDLAGQMTWDDDGGIAASKPDALAISSPDITIDSFTDTAPTLTIPDAPTLTFGSAPTLDFGTKPVGPTIDDPDMPVAPSVTLPDAPTFLTLSTPSFAGLDLHADLAAALETAPDLTLAAPTPFTYSPGPEYSSTLQSTLKTILTSRAGGGTGLDADVEQAIWDRDRARVAATGAANEAEVARTHEALGFHLPTGTLAAQLRAAQQDTIDKLATASRDVAIKQADLEQRNLEATITAGIQLENQLITYSYNLEQLAFNTAAKIADNAIQVHNAAVEQFRALVDRFRALREAYQAIIDGEKLKLEEYRGLLQAEQTKAEVNRTLVEQYKAQIEGQIALIRIFEGQLGAAKVQVEIGQAKVASFGEEVRAYVAGVNGETARVEAYKVNAEAQKTIADAVDSQIRGQVARLEVFKTGVEAYRAKTGAQAERARAQIAWYEGVVRAKQAEWEGWNARVRGEAERFRAITSVSNSVLDSFKAKAEVVLRTAEQDIRRWDVGIKQYEAQQNYTLAAQKINTDVIQHNQQLTLDAKKAGAAVLAQLAGSAMGMIHAQAHVSGTTQTQVGYAYKGNVNADVDPLTSI